MVRVYYHDNLETDPRLPHIGDPAAINAVEELGIITKHYEDIAGVNELAQARGYTNRDEYTLSKQTHGVTYDETLKMFYDEHLHIDEEIRYVVDGEGYADIRDKNERWVRIFLEKGDLYILPPGAYHRFSPSVTDYICAVRLFKDLPQWAAFPRRIHGDSLQARKEYKANFGLAQ